MAEFDFTWSTEWTNTGKPWDYNRPFHRIDSPSFDGGRAAADGRGYRCGCRSPEESSLWIADRLIAIAPPWVPVGRNRYDPDFVEEEKEVEGVLWQSFQTWTDVPLHQWHRWYDWNFHLVPARGYKYLRGEGNHPPGASEIPPGWQPVAPPPGGEVEPTMECEWDAGAFGKDIADSHPGAMFDSTSASTLDPRFDWAWPQSGQYVWIAGRWIYDCGHATSPERQDVITLKDGTELRGQIVYRGPDAEGRDVLSLKTTASQPQNIPMANVREVIYEGRMRSELHPCKAVATARWEAAEFDENEKHVPAIQFMFFASRFGGYWTFPSITDRDYEFVVDLPRIEAAPRAWDIGHTPDFPLNTVVLSPRLLRKFDSDPFAAAAGKVKGKDHLEPVIEPIPAADPANPPEQVKVKIPLTQLKGKEVDAYGVIVSLGWYDPDGSQARKVRKIRVEFPKVHKAAVNHDVGKEEWRLKVGVNGRWFSRNRNQVENDTDIHLEKTVELLLSEEDFITINAHGMEENQVGDFMKREEPDRTLRIDGQDATWKQDVDQPDIDRADQVAREARGMMSGCVRLVWAWPPLEADENTPLGLIPARITAPENELRRSWRVQVTDLVQQLDRGERLECVLTGFHAMEVGESAELAFNPAEVDYTLHYTLQVEDQ